MQGSDGDCGSETTNKETQLSVDRRSYLKLAGVAAGSVPLLTGTASAAFTHRGIQFERTVDMVRDAGCDPTGNEPCGAKIARAADDYTLLKFPAGTYRIENKTAILDHTNIGFLGEGSVRFEVPELFNEKVIVVDGGTGVLFEGIDIDQTAYGATPGLQLGADDDLRVHDVELIGQGINPDSIPKRQPGWEPGPGAENGNPDVSDYFFPIVRSADGTGLVTNFRANNHGLMGTYNAAGGRSGIWVGLQNEGTITFRNCHIEEFGSNGTYTSRTYGVVQFEGGVYRNNDNNQIRIGSAGSYIDGAILDVDADSSSSPNPYEALNYRGARLEMGHNYSRTDVTVRNCDISIRSSPHSGGGVVAESTAAEFHVENTRIGVDVDGVRGILAKYPDGGSYPPPEGPYAATLRDVSITGSATNQTAVELRGRPDSVVKGCCIHQEGSNRDGVILDESGGSVVRNSTIDVTGQQVLTPECQATASNIRDNGSCPVPEYGTGANLPRTLSIASNGGRYSYTFSVSGDLGKSTAMGASIDANDTISGSTATGQGGGGGVDSYGFSGEIRTFDLNGDATVYLDGDRIDPSRYPDLHTLTIEGAGPRTDYVFSVSSEIEKSTANGGSIGPSDSISGTTVTGWVGGGIDSYTFSGDLESFSLDGEANITLDGEPAHVGQRPDHVLTIEGTGPRTDYVLAVSDDLKKSTANNGSIGPSDSISRDTVNG
ncbi:MAG TPA: hypothetical protein VFJ06_10015, partial [Halococcus sp.]|nr:hypothetical protein [Halococcus sp.]